MKRKHNRNLYLLITVAPGFQAGWELKRPAGNDDELIAAVAPGIQAR
ncbi:hypothetical protein [Gelria sp. Kuro-4]|nr:hypothetical protein [Gelria sp. Kuro-4]